MTRNKFFKSIYLLISLTFICCSTPTQKSDKFTQISNQFDSLEQASEDLSEYSSEPIDFPPNFNYKLMLREMHASIIEHEYVATTDIDYALLNIMFLNQMAREYFAIPDNDSIKSDLEILRREITTRQMRYFPLDRKNYSELLNKELLTDNIGVKCSGKDLKTIRFASDIFTDTAKISYCYFALKNNMYDLRYNRIEFYLNSKDRPIRVYENEVVPDSSIYYRR